MMNNHIQLTNRIEEVMAESRIIVVIFVTVFMCLLTACGAKIRIL